MRLSSPSSPTSLASGTRSKYVSYVCNHRKTDWKPVDACLKLGRALLYPRPSRQDRDLYESFRKDAGAAGSHNLTRTSQDLTGPHRVQYLQHLGNILQDAPLRHPWADGSAAMLLNDDGRSTSPQNAVLMAGSSLVPTSRI